MVVVAAASGRLGQASTLTPLPDLLLHKRRQGFDVLFMHKTAARVDVQS